MSKKYMVYPRYLIFILFVSIIAAVGIVLTAVSPLSDTMGNKFVVMCVIVGVMDLGFFLYSLQFVSFSKEKIYIVSYTCFGIPIRSEYKTDKINEVNIYYGKDTTIDFYHIGKNVLNVQIRDEVLETILEYIPHDVIKVTLQCPQRVKGKQQQLITPLLSDKQKKELHSKGFFWCDG